MLVGNIDRLLEVRSLAEPFVNSEIANRKVAPVNRRGDVRKRHHLESIHTKIAQISHQVARTLQVATELGDVDLVEDQICQRWGAPVRLCRVPKILLVSERARRLVADTKLAGAWADGPVNTAD